MFSHIWIFHNMGAYVDDKEEKTLIRKSHDIGKEHMQWNVTLLFYQEKRSNVFF